MKVKFVFILGVTVLVAAPGALRAQALAAAGPVTAAEGWSGYRDGRDRVRVRRTGTRGDGLQTVICTTRGRTFQAALGADALVELSAEAPSDALSSQPDISLARPLSRRLRLFRVRGRPSEDGVQLALRLAQLPFVVQAIPDLHLPRRKAGIRVPPNDPQYSAQWYLQQMQIERAWQHTTGRPSTAVVVVDGGCDMDHPDLVDRFVGGRDLVDGDDDPSPQPRVQGNAHGTACAGVIAAAGDNGIGIAGVCPGCTLHCLRLYGQGDKKLVPISSDIAAFEYAFDVRAAVVSNSWGFADPMPVPEMLRRAIRSLIEEGRDGRGTLVVFAAGNENRLLGDDELVAVDGVLNVGAVNNFDEAAPFSNFGPSVDLTAPTATVTTDIAGDDGDDPGDYTDLFGGTSSACPVVAGVAALAVSAEPELTAGEVGALLIATARSAPYARPDARGHDRTYGFGIVDPVAAVHQALGIVVEPGGYDASVAPADAGTEGPDARAAIAVRRASCSAGTSGPGAATWPSVILVSVALLFGVASAARARRRCRQVSRGPSRAQVKSVGRGHRGCTGGPRAGRPRADALQPQQLH